MKNSTVTAYLEHKEKERLRVFADQHGTTMSTLVRAAIFQYIFMIERLMKPQEIE